MQLVAASRRGAGRRSAACRAGRQQRRHTHAHTFLRAAACLLAQAPLLRSGMPGPAVLVERLQQVATIYTDSS